VAPGARRATLWVALGLAALLAVEGLAALTTAMLTRRGWMAYVPRFPAGQVSHYLASRNPLLGWGPAVDGAGRVVETRPRPDPPRSLEPAPCVSVYGDSFTFGDEAADDATYPHFLAEALECRVDNFGVAGYGSDQALMLARAQAGADRAPVVVLGHLTENILRNVNQYRNLLYPTTELGFKPRFLSEGGELRYLASPVASAADFRRVESDPASVLGAEAFLSRPRRVFPYSLALLRWMAFDFHVRQRLTGTPRWAAFYDPGERSGALPLTVRILSAFGREAEAASRKAFVLLVPTGRDLIFAKRHGRFLDEPLARALRAEKVAVIEAAPRLLEAAGGEDPCALFVSCDGHFNARGYRLLAGAVAEAVRGWVPEPASR
jgi:hypothetical protein